MIIFFTNLIHKLFILILYYIRMHGQEKIYIKEHRFVSSFNFSSEVAQTSCLSVDEMKSTVPL